jgi:hypothetical protein
MRIARTLLFACSVLTGTDALAQSPAPRQAAVEVSVAPGGGTFFLEGGDTGASSFANYDVGGLLTINLNRRFAIEGEAFISKGKAQSLTLAGVRQELDSPDMLHLAGNLVLYTPAGGALVPFVTAGIGGLMISDQAELFIPDTRTYLAGNAGAGVKWYGSRWGLRADYRFLVVRAAEFAPDPLVRLRQPFFGTETRFAHRVFGGVILKID